MTKSQRRAHKTGNQLRKQQILKGETRSGFVWKVIQTPAPKAKA